MLATPTANTSTADAQAKSTSTRPEKSSLKRKLHKKRRKLRKLKTHLTAIRSQLNCSICFELLIDPFITVCGHSFCYTCIAEWFSAILNDEDDDDGRGVRGVRRQCICPACRQVINQRPVRNIIVSQLIDLIMDHMKNGTDGKESLRRRREFSRESLARDSLNGQLPLWEGMFAGDALNDDSDGVKRCAGCLWEIVNGQCINCGVAYTGGRLSDNDGDNDGESESEGEEEDDCSEEEDYLPTDEDFSDEIDSDLEDDGSTSDQSNRPDVIDIEAGDRLKNTPRKRHSEDQGGDTKKRRVIISDDDDSSNSDT